MFPVETIIGVMGGSEADEGVVALAYELGSLIASEGWVLLNGGRACGVMDASARGAKEAGGLVVGVLPDSDASQASRFVDIPIVTDLGHGRNYVNVLSSRVVIALPGAAGTLSEVALALAIGRKVITLGADLDGPFDGYVERGLLVAAGDPPEVIRLIKEELRSRK